MGGIDAEVENPNNPRDKAAILDYRVVLRGQDGKDEVVKSGSMNRDSAPIQLDVDVRNAKYLILEVNNGGGQGNWGRPF